MTDEIDGARLHWLLKHAYVRVQMQTAEVAAHRLCRPPLIGRNCSRSRKIEFRDRLPRPAEITPQQQSFRGTAQRLPGTLQLIEQSPRRHGFRLVLQRDMRTVTLPILRDQVFFPCRGQRRAQAMQCGRFDFNCDTTAKGSKRRKLQREWSGFAGVFGKQFPDR